MIEHYVRGPKSRGRVYIDVRVEPIDNLDTTVVTWTYSDHTTYTANLARETIDHFVATKQWVTATPWLWLPEGL